MTTTIALAAAAIVVGYLWIGARMWRAMMGAHRVLTLADDPSDPAALFQAAWVRGDPRIHLFQFTFVALWPACLAIGRINAAIEDRRAARICNCCKGL